MGYTCWPRKEDSSEKMNMFQYMYQLTTISLGKRDITVGCNQLRQSQDMAITVTKLWKCKIVGSWINAMRPRDISSGGSFYLWAHRCYLPDTEWQDMRIRKVIHILGFWDGTLTQPGLKKIHTETRHRSGRQEEKKWTSTMMKTNFTVIKTFKFLFFKHNSMTWPSCAGISHYFVDALFLPHNFLCVI